MKKTKLPGSKPSEEICIVCGKNIPAADTKGTITAYLFQGAVCTCNEGKNVRPDRVPTPGFFNSLSQSIERVVSSRASANQIGSSDDKACTEPDNAEFCPRCGLMLAGDSKPGSITSYLFQDIRCKCAPDPVFAPGQMTQKLFRLKQNDNGSTFDSAGGPAGLVNLAPGAIIGGAYRIESLIGKGGMGEVYLAEHISLGKRCSIKLVPPQQVNEVGWLRFQREARALSKLNHPNIVQVTDLGIHDGCLPYYAMEFVDGRNLAEILAAYGPLPLTQAIEIFKQICDGLDSAHRNGVIHRDLKPGNIMVAGTFVSPQIKILDFGLAKLTQADRFKQSLTLEGELFGSPFYMSPEQCMGEQIDNRSDIYSIGCTLFECLTGKPPFSGNMLGAIIRQHESAEAPSLESVAGHKFPDHMEALVARALRKKPGDRYKTARALKTDLERLANTDARQEIEFPDDQENEVGAQDQTAVKKRLLLPALTLAAGIMLVFASALTTFWSQNKIFDPEQVQPEHRNDNAAAESFRRQASGQIGQDFSKPGIIFDRRPYLRVISSSKSADSKAYVFPDNLPIIEGDRETGIGWFNAKPPGYYNELIPQRHTMESHYYSPSYYVLLHPEFFEGFSDGDFHSLTIRWPGDYDPQLLEKYPAKLWQMKSVDDLSIQQLPFPSSDKVERMAVTFINHFVHIRRLSLGVPLSPPACAQLKLPPKLEEFQVCEVNDISGYISALKQSKDLKRLGIEGARIEQNDLNAISHFSNLQVLVLFQLKNRRFTASNLEPLSKLSNLLLLCLPTTTYSPEAVEKLAQLKGLKQLTFRPYSSWSPAQLTNLRIRMAWCTITGN